MQDQFIGTPASSTASLTTSASDPINVSNVVYSLTNGSNTLTISGAITTSPYTFSWDTTKIVDGSYTLQATCTNIGGATQVGTQSITLSNGVTAKNYFFSPAGSDSNNCTTSGTACATAAKFATLAFHGGDTVSFDAGNGALSTTAPFVICGPGGVIFSALPHPGNNFLFPGATSCSANFFPGVLTFTVSSYNGGTCNALAASTNCAPITQVAGSSTNGITDLFQCNNCTNTTIKNFVLDGRFVTDNTGREWADIQWYHDWPNRITRNPRQYYPEQLHYRFRHWNSYLQR